MKFALILAAWSAVALSAVGLHPALQSGTPLGELGLQIAEDAKRGDAVLRSLGLSGGRASVAFWALDLSLLYIALWALFRLCPRRETPDPSIPTALLVAVLAGQAAATFALDATGFYFLSSGAAAVSLFFLKRAPVLESRPRAIRLLLVCTIGFLVVVLASPLDTVTGAAMLPEIWFPLVVEYGSRPAVGVALTGVVAAGIAALGFARGGWLGLAPACVLALGPSNPAKGLAAAGVVVLLGRAGAGPGWRAGFLAAVTILFFGIAFRM